MTNPQGRLKDGQLQSNIQNIKDTRKSYGYRRV